MLMPIGDRLALLGLAARSGRGEGLCWSLWSRCSSLAESQRARRPVGRFLGVLLGATLHMAVVTAHIPWPRPGQDANKPGCKAEHSLF